MVVSILTVMDAKRENRAVPATNLDQLPVHRRETMLWRQAWRYSYEDLDDIIGSASSTPCRIRLTSPETDESVAILGSDGRYHLRLPGGRVLCSGRRRDDKPTMQHKEWFFWWTDGERYRIQTPYVDGEPLPGKRGRLTFRWAVQLTNEQASPADIPRRRRCPVNSRYSHWPTFLNTKSALGRIRRQLVKTFGPWCAGCGRNHGTCVDHDHFTGLVRGLLCHCCNTHIDDCPHLSACSWADYLNDPPATPLGLLHPDRALPRRREDRRSWV